MTAQPSTEALTRQCGRCREHFAIEAGPDGSTPRDWWVCDTCRAALFPRRGVTANDGAN
jgi:hypothetical protein